MTRLFPPLHRELKLFDPWRQIAIILDYEFGKGTSKALPKKGLKLIYSKRSERVRQVTQDGKLFATIKPNGAVALTIYGARTLARSRAFLENSVVVKDEAVEFVKEGKSVFCKFVESVGSHVLPGGEVVVLDGRREVIGVGRVKIHGKFIKEFATGVAVKVRGSFA
jgi:predicted RNA-binding protein (TIGR00451 family)